MYPQNGDLTKLLKSARKKVPQSARLSAGGGVQKLKGQCPNAPSMNLRGASLTGPRENPPSPPRNVTKLFRGAVQTFFWVNLGFCPNEGGGGSRQSQLFIKIAQNLICLGTVHKCDETHST